MTKLKKFLKYLRNGLYDVLMMLNFFLIIRFFMSSFDPYWTSEHYRAQCTADPAGCLISERMMSAGIAFFVLISLFFAGKNSVWKWFFATFPIVYLFL